MAAASTSTATVNIRGTEVNLTAESHISADTLKAVTAAVPFVDWTKSLDPALEVRKIHVQSVDYFGPRVGFIKFTTETFFNGTKVPGIVFMRGGAVAILVVLRCGDERWALCCRQPRVPCGRADFLEIPAGMLDGSGHFAGVAAKELEEETGIVISDDELVDMTELAYGQAPLTGGSGAATASAAGASGATAASGSSVSTLRGVYPSVGACDEFLRLMYYSKEVTPAELEALKGKATGLMDHGECITLDLVKLDDLWRKAPDGKTLCSLFLYDKLRASGAIKA